LTATGERWGKQPQQAIHTEHFAPALLSEVITLNIKQESDVRGWIKDPEKLKVALATLHERKETARKLAGVLTEIQQQGVQAQ
jgi:hypothetical protein